MSGHGGYCSDCAWPYECAAEKACRRRDQGQIRAREYRGEVETPALEIEVQVSPGFRQAMDRFQREWQPRIRDAIRKGLRGEA